MTAIDAVPGVQHGTGRDSLENAALSFAFDPARASTEAAQRELARKLESKRLGVAPAMICSLKGSWNLAP